MLPLGLILIPLLSGLISWLLPQPRWSAWANVAGATLTLGWGWYLALPLFLSGQTYTGAKDFFYLDSLSALLLLLVVTIGFVTALYSVGYLQADLNHKQINQQQYRRYFLWFHLFIMTMNLTLIVNNLGIMWVAIEATTLASAVLVGLYNQKTSLEAAWKYLILCTVGITFALFGLILVFYAAGHTAGNEQSALNYTVLLQVVKEFDPQLLKLAFIFILVGYGTKMGLAPMHNWLPDAHSQAPSPVSAVLSGVLLNCAFYGILRFFILVNTRVDGQFAPGLLVIFGLISLGISVPFILMQYDLKRLLAYSSVEHMGIITLAVGLGGKWGLLGGLLHLINHSFTKSFLFMLSGNVVHKYHTRTLARIKGLLQTMPVSGPLLVIGLFAIAGAPPFSIFISELTILTEAFQQGRWWVAGLLFFFLALVFAGMLYHGGKMLLSNKSSRQRQGEGSHWQLWPLLLPLTAILVLGIYQPPRLVHALQQVAAIISPGGAY
ncbi:MAG: hydrogenase 4 subunit F [Bacillota bacterium]